MGITVKNPKFLDCFCLIWVFEGLFVPNQHTRNVWKLQNRSPLVLYNFPSNFKF